MMDVNYLLHRQQVSLIRATLAKSASARASHETLARAYREQINAYRESNCMSTPPH